MFLVFVKKIIQLKKLILLQVQKMNFDYHMRMCNFYASPMKGGLEHQDPSKRV
jgi:hypothetical protein